MSCIKLAIAAIALSTTHNQVSGFSYVVKPISSYQVRTHHEFPLRMSTTPTEEKELKAEQEEEDDTIFDPMHLSENLEDSLEPFTKPEDEFEHQPLGIWAARAILLGVAILWGTNFASVKYLTNLCFHPPCNHPPSEAALARFGVASLASAPFLIGQRKDVILGGMECGLLIALGYIAQAVALAELPSGKCAFICSLTVVIVPLVSAIFFGKPIRPVNIAAAGLALSGVGILEGLVDVPSLLGIAPAVASPEVVTGSSELVSSSSGIGGLTQADLIALGQPFGFGISFLRIEHYVEKFKEVPNRVLTISAAQCVAVGLVSLLWVLWDFHTFPDMSYMIEPHRIAVILWTGLMTTVVAVYFQGFALQVASSTEASLLFASEPVWATLFGSWLLNEQLNASTFIGGAFILSACLLTSIFDLVGQKKEVEEA